MLAVTVARHAFKLRGRFAISRGAKTEAYTLIVSISDGAVTGRGECVPYERYGESLESVEAQIAGVRGRIADGMDRAALQEALPAGAARNALDCALWDFEARRTGKPVWELAGRPRWRPVTSVMTISLDTVEAMAAAAAKWAHLPRLKLKLTGDGDLDRVTAVRAAAPKSAIVVDANEGWSMRHLEQYAGAFHDLGVEMIEQPLPTAEDDQLKDYDGPVVLCADESCHTRESLPALAGKYGMVNVKLDKTGGLTEALALGDAARAAGFRVMLGCMMGSSLSMAPGVLAAQGAEIVDLDAPLWLAEDVETPLAYIDTEAQPPSAALWGNDGA
ncbi:MAG: N-acetyl-D-Glu racemase DgcA [Azospirillaceae bacterium]